MCLDTMYQNENGCLMMKYESEWVNKRPKKKFFAVVDKFSFFQRKKNKNKNFHWNPIILEYFARLIIYAHI